MTAQLSAPANATALYTDPTYEPTLEEWNWLVHEGGAGADVVEAMERLRTMASYADAVDVYPRDAWAAPPDVMRRFLDAIDERYGGVAELLMAHGVGADVVLRLTDLLIDPTPDAC